MMQSRSLLLALLLLAPMAHAADSPKDVQALIAKGDYPGAEAMLRQAIAEHPQSAKAHYVLAEVLAHEGNIGDAKAEAARAATLDPGTHFTDPAKFQAFRRKLDAALAPSSSGLRAATSGLDEREQAPQHGRSGGSHLLNILAIGAGIALLVFLWMRRRRPDVPPAGYAPVPPPEGMPPYGSYSGAPYGAPPQPHSGVGTAVAAGLGGVAAGMLLDEALRGRHDEDGFRDSGTVIREDRDPSAQAYDDLRDEPIDMGNNDSSWDDSGSSGGGFDDDDSW